ncbi:MAG: metallophosphoesterase family protein [Gammaproteobacteria bacterium]
MKVCILSDSHDNRALLETAVADAKPRGAEAVLHCGDVVAPSTLSVIQPFGLPVHVIHGNNTGDLYVLTRMSHRPGGRLHYHGQDAGLELGGRRIFMVHYPHYARAMAVTGDWDLVCCGHDHAAHVEHVTTIKGGETVLVNPGTVGGVGAAATYVLGDLESMAFELIEIGAQAPSTSPASGA